jgi:hypothetical protein
MSKKDTTNKTRLKAQDRQIRELFRCYLRLEFFSHGNFPRLHHFSRAQTKLLNPKHRDLAVLLSSACQCNKVMRR